MINEVMRKKIEEKRLKAIAIRESKKRTGSFLSGFSQVC